MLKTRLLTASILVPLVVALVLLLPNLWFALAVAVITVLGSWELSRLAGMMHLRKRAWVVLAMVATIGLLYVLSQYFPALWLMHGLAVWWLLNVFIMLFAGLRPSPQAGFRPFVLLQGILGLAGFWAALVFLHADGDEGAYRILFLLVLIWVADSGAYFAGKRFGKHKLAPHISPGKTIEGVLGALLGALLCAAFGASLLALPWLGLSLVCVATVWVSIGGDLWESVIKRKQGAKDSGHLLPGHGGILDRIDSLIAAAPFFVSSLSLLERV